MELFNTCELIDNIDYKLAPQKVEQNKHGGNNKKNYLITRNAFIELCMRKDNKIRKYFIEL